MDVSERKIARRDPEDPQRRESRAESPPVARRSDARSNINGAPRAVGNRAQTPARDRPAADDGARVRKVARRSVGSGARPLERGRLVAARWQSRAQFSHPLRSRPRGPDFAPEQGNQRALLVPPRARGAEETRHLVKLSKVSSAGR